MKRSMKWQSHLTQICSVVLLLGLVSPALAHTTPPPVPQPSHHPEKHPEPHARLKALENAVEALTARVAKLEQQPTAADVAGTYAFVALEVENGTGPTVHHAIQNGTLTLNADGTFSLNATDYSSHLNLGFNPMTGLTANTTVNSGPLTDSGTWSLNGKVLTLVLSGAQMTVDFISAGPTSFMNAIRSPDGRDHSLVFLLRVN